MPIDPKLIETLLTSAEVQARAEAAKKLAHLASGAQSAAVALVRASGDEAEIVRQWATAALEELGPPRSDDLPQLVSLATNPDTDIAYWGVTLLGRLKQAAAASTLAEVLIAHPALPVRERAAWALGQIGPAAQMALQNLEQAATSEEPRLARLARQAIERIKP